MRVFREVLGVVVIAALLGVGVGLIVPALLRDCFAFLQEP
jgi:hypothetical protein